MKNSDNPAERVRYQRILQMMDAYEAGKQNKFDNAADSLGF